LEFREWQTLNVRRRISLPDGQIWPQSLAVSSDGRLVAVASYEETLVLFDRNSGELLAESQRQNTMITGTSFSPDSRLLAAAYTDQGGGDFVIFDVSQWKLDVLHKSLPRDAMSHFDLADSVAASVFSPSGEYFATYDTGPDRQDDQHQGSVALYRMPGALLMWAKALASNEIAQEFERPGNTAPWFHTQPAFSADNQILYVGTTGGNVIALSTTDGAEVGRLKMAHDQFVPRVEVDTRAGKLWIVRGDTPISTSLFN
jgi:hypothetical protein